MTLENAFLIFEKKEQQIKSKNTQKLPTIKPIGEHSKFRKIDWQFNEMLWSKLRYQNKPTLMKMFNVWLNLIEELKNDENSKFQRKSKLIITQFDPQTKSDWKLVNQKKISSTIEWLNRVFLTICSFLFFLFCFAVFCWEIYVILACGPYYKHIRALIYIKLFFSTKK